MPEEGSIQFCQHCQQPVKVPFYRPSDGPGRPVHIATGKEDC
jgi:hypothetical protein